MERKPERKTSGRAKEVVGRRLSLFAFHAYMYDHIPS